MKLETMSYPRVAIPLDNSFLVRYLLHTGMLKALAKFTQPIVLLRWENDALKQELVNAGAEVYPLPRFFFGREYEHLRHRLSIWRNYERQIKTTEIERRMHLARLDWKSKINRILRDGWANIEMHVPGVVNELVSRETDVFWRDTNVHDFEELLIRLNFDAIFSVTPFLIGEEPLLRAAKRMGIKLFTSILSFDNLTTKDPLPVLFDLYCVWNRYNAAEITRFYPSISADKIVITGPPQFDFYWRKELLFSREEWLVHIGASRDNPILLFGAGPDWIAPNEPHWLKQILDAIATGEIVGKPSVLFRKHPVDNYQRWGALIQSSKILIDKSWNAIDVKENVSSLDDVKQLIATLKYSAVHISAASTLSVDGSVFDRPQICPAYDDRLGHVYDYISRQTYLREHYLPITYSGGLALAYSREELIGSINDALQNPNKLMAGRKKIVEDICTFTDGLSTQRVVRAVADQLGVKYP